MRKFKIMGCVSSNEISYRPGDTYKQFPYYETVATVDLGTREFCNLDEAREWFEYNYPTLVPGGCIHEIDETKSQPDFCLYAVKGYDGHYGVDDIHANIRKI